MKITCINTADDSVASMFRPFDLKMEEQGLPPIVINVFKCYYNQLLYGAQGKLRESEIKPLTDADVRDYSDLERYAEFGREALSSAVMIKLNGGLGTSMGLEKAKSLITVRDELSFLDIILRQTEKLREDFGVMMPLLFMNSFKTHKDTMLRVGEFKNPDEAPLAFLQHKYPKILAEDYTPAEWPANPDLEWNPPGHGDLYTALVTSGVLTKLLNNGYFYAFISNSDNMGAAMDERILGYMAHEKRSFVMEAAERTPADKKGGHLARLIKNDRLVLREVAQCAESDMPEFQNTEKHRFFNTNSLWLDLRTLERVFVQHHMMPLDLIINPKTLDPRDSDSPRVLQIETAMGSAISAFENASAVRVPRDHFAPVKTTNDLLLVMSDCYVRTERETIEPNPERGGAMPIIDLDKKYFKKIDDFLSRFPDGAPLLLECSSLTVSGDVLFEADVKAVGVVRVVNNRASQVRVSAGKVLEGEVSFD